MSEFLYATNSPLDEKLRARILDGTGRLCQRQVSNFDQGGSSREMWIFSRRPRIEYDPARQKWNESGEFRGLWVGCWLDDMPGPETLQRERTIAGYNMKLGDGNTWAIPLVRELSGGTRLPQASRMNPRGTLISETAAEYRDFEKQINQFWAALAFHLGLSEIQAVSLTTAQMFKLACCAISQNYRIGMDETGLLELLDSETMEEVILHCVDKPRLEDMIKKIRDTRETQGKNINKER
jgi:hypothetical protein